MKHYCVYIRVSTQKQGRSGLGLESQQKICGDFIKSNNGVCVAEFMDVESGTHRERKGLADAISFCKKNECGLVIAKLDRLARDVEFCFRVINTGIEIHFVDMPQINTLLLGVFASVAQYERELTSDRTKKALAAKKQRGEVTGGASERWRDSFNKKTRDEKDCEYRKRATTRSTRYVESREVQAFLRVLRNVFSDACANDNPALWDWKEINTKGDNKSRILKVMIDYKGLDESGNLFNKWNFDDDLVKLQVRISSTIKNIRRSFKGIQKNNEDD